jgi:hypothetical protein
MLNSFQLYVYSNHYDQNSFFLNVYDNRFDHSRPASRSGVVDYDNALIRIRLLALLAKMYSSHDFVEGEELPSFPCIHIIEDMSKLGYTPESTWRAMRAFAAHRLIRTGRWRNELATGQSEISVSTAVVFYLDYLMYEYRYIENVLLVTPVDFWFDPEDIPTTPETKDFRALDRDILAFANFMERCEKEELARAGRDNPVLHRIWPGEPPSARIRSSVGRFQARRF